MITSNLTADQLNALLNASPIQPPLGIAHNPVSPYAAVSSATQILCLIVPTAVVAGRIFTRLRILQEVGLDDYNCILAWLGLLTYIGLFYLALNAGFGLYQWDLTLREMIHMNQMVYYIEVLYGPVAFTAKLSILLQYLRAFVPSRTGNEILFYGVHVTIWANLVFYALGGILAVFQCAPRESNWNPLIPGRCAVNKNTTFIVTAAVNLVSDISILLLPVSSIWHLQIPMREKAKISAVFAVGLLACAISLARLVYTIHFAARTADANLEPVGLWTLAGLSVGIICGCLPVLPRLFKHCRPKVASLLPQCRTALVKENPSTSSLQDPYAKASIATLQELETSYNTLYDEASVTVAAMEFPSPCYHPDNGLLPQDRGAGLDLHLDPDLEQGVREGSIWVNIEVELESEDTFIEAESCRGGC